MASVFKRGGKRNRHGHYTAAYFDENGRRVARTTGTADFDAAHQIAAKWETEVALRRRGIIDATAERFADHKRTPIGDHVRDYLDHCRGHESRIHVLNKTTQLNKLITGIDAKRLSDLDPNAIERYLRGLVDSGLSHRTHNQHRATVVAFAEFLVERGRLASNPLNIIPKLNEAKDRRLIRREITDDELARLLVVPEAIAAGRDLYYLFATLTGLRVKAVKAATWSDLDLDAGVITVRAKNAKGKRDDVYFPLHPQLITRLAEAKPPFAKPTDRIFKRVPRPSTLTGISSAPGSTSLTAPVGNWTDTP